MLQQLDHIELLDQVPAVATGKPLQVPIDLIDEDPDQPRMEFDQLSLQEMADTIAQDKVHQPISVRPHPERAGRWLLNFGARRLRASKQAGKTEIPAFVDETADSYAQVIENEQRQALKPLELALFIQRELHKGVSQAHVAKRLGKSGAHITYLCALIDAPEWLMVVYRDGKCVGVKELYDLRRLHERDPVRVEQWLQKQVTVSRVDVTRLQEELRTSVANTPCSASASSNVVPLASQANTAKPPVKLPRANQTGQTSSRGREMQPQARASEGAVGVHVVAVCDGRTVRVMLDQVPHEVGQVFVTYADGHQCEAVSISCLQSLQLFRGAPDADQKKA